jgi:Leucine-rich repeat (LRR) protein
MPQAFSPKTNRNILSLIILKKIFQINYFDFQKTESGCVFIRSISLVMSDQNISHVGDCQELANSCKNVQELDLSKNEINDWNEVIKKNSLYFK